MALQATFLGYNLCKPRCLYYTGLPDPVRAASCPGLTNWGLHEPMSSSGGRIYILPSEVVLLNHLVHSKFGAGSPESRRYRYPGTTSQSLPCCPLCQVALSSITRRPKISK